MYPLWDYEIKLSPKLLPFCFQEKSAKKRDFGPFLGEGMVEECLRAGAVDFNCWRGRARGIDTRGTYGTSGGYTVD